MLEIQASELIINLSDQKKAGTLMLAMYNNAEAFEGSVVKAVSYTHLTLPTNLRV